MWRFEEFRKTPRRDATRRTCKVVWIIYALQPEAYIGNVLRLRIDGVSTTLLTLRLS